MVRCIKAYYKAIGVRVRVYQIPQFRYRVLALGFRTCAPSCSARCLKMLIVFIPIWKTVYPFFWPIWLWRFLTFFTSLTIRRWTSKWCRCSKPRWRDVCTRPVATIPRPLGSGMWSIGCWIVGVTAFIFPCFSCNKIYVNMILLITPWASIPGGGYELCLYWCVASVLYTLGWLPLYSISKVHHA